MTSKKSVLLHPLHMHPIPYKKILIVLLLGVVLVMPEDTVDFLLSGFHYAYEGFEYLLEEIIQRVFHVDKSESQTYVFYILIAMAACLAVLIYRILPTFLNKLKIALSHYYLQQKQCAIGFWHNLSTLQKTLLVTVYIPGFLYISSFFIM